MGAFEAHELGGDQFRSTLGVLSRAGNRVFGPRFRAAS